MPAGSFGYPGDNGTVIAPADHNAGIVRAIGLKMADRGKKLLVPGTEQDRSTGMDVGHPLAFILNPQAKSPGIGPDKPVNEAYEPL